MRILLVEDDARLLLSLAQILERNGFYVDRAASFLEGYEKVFLVDYDLIILDWMLPDGSGVELCKKIRNELIMCPIILLTAKSMSEDIIEGLDSGADDFLTKPFETVELLARIRARLRRKEDFKEDAFELDNLRIDFLKRIVKRDNRLVRLSPKEYSVLEYLAKNSDRVVTRDEILEHTSDEFTEGFSNTVDVYISHLRKKIDLGKKVPLITTVKGAGYRLCKN